MSSRAPGRYLVGVVAVAVALLLRLALSGILSLQARYIMFLPAVLLAAMLGGVGPGLVATALSAVLAWFWILPPAGRLFPIGAPDTVSLILFVGLGVIVTLIVDLYHKAQRRLVAAERDLAVRGNEEWLRLSREASNSGAWEWDPRSDMCSWSEEMWKLQGLEPHSCVPSYDAWRETLHPDDLPKFEQDLRKAVGAGADLSAEWRVRHSGVPPRWLLVRGRALRDPDGRVARYIGISIDITDRKRAEAALRESEEKHRAFFENMQEFAAVHQAVRDERGLVTDWTIRDVNARTRASFEPVLRAIGRLARDEPLLGNRVSSLLEPERVAWLTEKWLGVLAGEPASYERSFGGREYAVTAFKAIEGTVATVAFDVTDRKRAEEALREADRRKNEFLGILSHELRNPLAPIRNGIHLLERVPADSPEARRAKEIIKRQTAHLSLIVDDLLDVTRIGRGKIELDRKRVDLREVVLRTCHDHRSLFDQDRVQLRHDLPPSPVWIEADATRISQILGNLLQNALKFTPATGIVRVEVAVREGNAAISVSDTGVGMRPEEVEHMFEPFAQGAQSMARPQGGLGLGLALVKGLVELHGGSVRARSDGPGRGSEFCVRLPLAPAPAPAITAEPPASARTVGQGLVLIIEDNVDTSQSLSAVLELAGLRVRTARDGRAGIAAAHELRPDVVLCDIGLPDVDGYEVARKLRSDEALRATRLIALSGYARPEDRRRASEAGFDAHISKPPELDSLIELLAREP